MMPLKLILEAVLMAADEPLSIERLLSLFDISEKPTREEITTALQELQTGYATSAVELIEVASGYRIQTKQAYAGTIARLWEEKPPRYSRALLETLALIAYKQPLTRAEIEEIRGVGANTATFKTLMEREWIRIVGHREVPGKPALYATTKSFLDYFGLKNLSELPPLPEIKENNL